MEISVAQRQVLTELKRNGPATVEALGRRMVLAPGTVRAHLNALSAAGLVEFVRTGQGPGRRRHVYHLTRAADAYFPSHSSFVLDQLVRALARDHPEWLAQFATALSQDVRDRLQASGRRGDFHGYLQEAAHLFERNGYMPELREDPGGRVGEVELHHCPFFAIASAWPGFCEIERENFAEGFPGSTVVRTAHRLRGDRTCIYAVFAPGHAGEAKLDRQVPRATPPPPQGPRADETGHRPGVGRADQPET